AVGTNAVEVADADAVLGILPDADIDAVAVEDRRRDQVVARAEPAELPLRVLRVAVELPDERPGLRLVAVEPTVAPRKDDLRASSRDAEGGIRPLAVEDVLARIGAVPNELA